jgi:hypothetical protein
MHRWQRKRNPEGGEPYLECERCHKERTISRSAIDGIGGG